MFTVRVVRARNGMFCSISSRLTSLHPIQSHSGLSHLISSHPILPFPTVFPPHPSPHSHPIPIPIYVLIPFLALSQSQPYPHPCPHPNLPPPLSLPHSLHPEVISRQPRVVDLQHGAGILHRAVIDLWGPFGVTGCEDPRVDSLSFPPPSVPREDAGSEPLSMSSSLSLFPLPSLCNLRRGDPSML